MNKEDFGSFLLGISRIGRVGERGVSRAVFFPELVPGFSIDESAQAAVPGETEALSGLGFVGASGSVRR